MSELMNFMEFAIEIFINFFSFIDSSITYVIDFSMLLQLRGEGLDVSTRTF